MKARTRLHNGAVTGHVTRMRRLPIPYLPVPALAILEGLHWLTEYQLVQDPAVAEFLSDLPMGAMWVVVLSLAVGAAWQDVANPKSRLREYLSERRRIFYLGDLMAGQAYSIRLIAVADMRLVNISVRFTAMGQTTNFPRGKFAHAWAHVARGESLYLPLATVTEPLPGHGPSQQVYWGANEVLEWGKGDRHTRNQPSAITRIDIEAHSSWRRQRETIHAVCRNHNAAFAEFIFWRGEDQVLYST